MCSRSEISQCGVEILLKQDSKICSKPMLPAWRDHQHFFTKGEKEGGGGGIWFLFSYRSPPARAPTRVDELEKSETPGSQNILERKFLTGKATARSFIGLPRQHASLFYRTELSGVLYSGTFSSACPAALGSITMLLCCRGS